MSILVVVPCGKAKIWDGTDREDPVRARKAYTGSLFTLHRLYAEKVCNKWIILSAKYGLIDPDELIKPYDVTFKKPCAQTVLIPKLVQQIEELGLDDFDRVVGLGGKEYRERTAESFSHYSKEVEFPFAGLGIFALTKALKQARQSKGFL